MCLGVPGRVEELDPAAASAVVDVEGARRSVCTLLLGDDVGPGDWVLVHVGFAMARIDEAEATATLDLLAAAVAAEDGPPPGQPDLPAGDGPEWGGPR